MSGTLHPGSHQSTGVTTSLFLSVSSSKILHQLHGGAGGGVCPDLIHRGAELRPGAASCSCRAPAPELLLGCGGETVHIVVSL